MRTVDIYLIDLILFDATICSVQAEQTQSTRICDPCYDLYTLSSGVGSLNSFSTFCP